jgi:hypothetical protein
VTGRLQLGAAVEPCLEPDIINCNVGCRILHLGHNLQKNDIFWH